MNCQGPVIKTQFDLLTNVTLVPITLRLHFRDD
jgi:hypothetical protein